MTERVARLSYFFPAHNEEANLEGLVAEALETLPTLADAFEIIIVDDGSRDATGAIADELAAANPGVVRAVHHPTNLGYGAALRSGFRAARHELVAFTDGDRQFRVADLGRLIDAPRPRPIGPTSSSATGSSGRTRSSGRSTPGLYRFANRVFFGLQVRDVDCACKLFRREALEGIAVESGGAFFSAELLIKLQAAGRSIVEVGVPHYPRTAGSPTGAKPSVIFRAVRDFWSLRLRLWSNRARALRRGTPVVGEPAGGLAPAAAPRPVPGSTSSEFTKSRNTSSRGSTICSPVDSSGDPAGRLLVALADRRRPRRAPPARGPPREAKIRPPARTARASASDGRESTSTIRPSRSSRSRAWNVSSASAEMITRSTRTPRPSRAAANRSWVSGRSGGQALELHRDRARLPRPDPDRQVALALGLLEDHDVAAREHVDPDALDDHLDEPVTGRLLAGHGRDYPTPALGERPASAGRVRRAVPRTSSPIAAPATKPPMWAKNATPPSAPARPSDAIPSTSWRTNQKPEDEQRRDLDELVEEAEEHERQDPRAREQHEVGAEDRRDRARRADHRDRRMSGRSGPG